MYRVSDEQIDYILNDIRRRGVEMEDLQLNLLDHICCIAERDLKEDENFEDFYQRTIRSFFKDELWEIEEETIQLLTFKHFFLVKRILYILLFLSVSYNLYIFGRMGYSFYEMRKWKNETKILDAVSFEDGLSEFKGKLEKENPDALKKEYTFISFSPRFWTIDPDFTRMDLDTAQSQLEKNFDIKRTKRLDSIASIYNKNITYIQVYALDDARVIEDIKEKKQYTTHLNYLPGAPKIIYGYKHKKQQIGNFIPTHFIIDKKGNIVYERGVNASTVDAKLIQFLKSIE